MTTAEMFKIIEKMYKDLQELMAMEKQEQLEESSEEEYENETDPGLDTFNNGYAMGMGIPPLVDRFANPNHGRLIPSVKDGYGGLGVCININLGEKENG